MELPLLWFALFPSGFIPFYISMDLGLLYRSRFCRAVVILNIGVDLEFMIRKLCMRYMDRHINTFYVKPSADMRRVDQATPYPLGS